MSKSRKCKQMTPHDPHSWQPITYPSFGKRNHRSRGLVVIDFWCTGRQARQQSKEDA